MTDTKQEKRFYIENFGGIINVRDRESQIHPIVCGLPLDAKIIESDLNAALNTPTAPVSDTVSISRECAKWCKGIARRYQHPLLSENDKRDGKNFEAELQQALSTPQGEDNEPKT